MYAYHSRLIPRVTHVVHVTLHNTTLGWAAVRSWLAEVVPAYTSRQARLSNGISRFAPSIDQQHQPCQPNS